ncbi:hypothetical protein AKJ47_01240 [candidate division MSBL1 archaeon SCGC-AAA261G05]|uniref:HTH HARE-type domain-containing protein n=1 Tax=candidate division MSBL1 archaeon SCGC-AAA261G05 TaxID=1698276 RepID=A0A133VC17_9EURY|nr:hypothetical protein AKJ47_01240 [candidate division MSBL1 archaeon SCGC-AAA261G05]
MNYLLGKSTFIEAAYKVLKKENQPLSAEEITSIAIKDDLISTKGKTPSATMSAQIYMGIKRKGKDSRFRKVGPGIFGLREWEQPSKTPAFRKGSFKRAAYETLKQAGKPMSAEDITKISLNRGLLETSGKTPDATMGAQLYMDIKKKEDESFFVQLGKNRFGLREWGLEALEEDIEKVEKEKVPTAADKKRSIVGDPINLKGLVYGPINENGVIFLFAKVHEELAYVEFSPNKDTRSYFVGNLKTNTFDPRS